MSRKLDARTPVEMRKSKFCYTILYGGIYSFAMVARKPIGVSESLALHVTVSAGVGVFPDDADSGLALLNAADKALYAAKARGRNRAVAFTEL